MAGIARTSAAFIRKISSVGPSISASQLFLRRGIASKLFIKAEPDTDPVVASSVSVDEPVIPFPLNAEHIHVSSNCPRFPAYEENIPHHPIHDYGLPFSTTESALAKEFSKFGEVVEARIAMDKVRNRSKGFGFVTFSSFDDAQNALDDMNGKILDGRVIYVDMARPSKHFDNYMPIARGPPEAEAEAQFESESESEAEAEPATKS